MLYMRYFASSYLNPCKVFLYIHTWVSFWYKLLSFIWEEQSFTCKFQSMDTTRGIFGLLEQTVVIVFSLLLEETLNLAMLPFISLSYTVIHHKFQFLCLIDFSEFIRLVVLWFLIQSLVVLAFLSFLEYSCSSSCFYLSLRSMEFSIDSMP